MQDALQVDQLLIEGIIAIGKKTGEDVLSVNKPIDLGSNAIQSSAAPEGDNYLMSKAQVASLVANALTEISAAIEGLEFKNSVKSIAYAPTGTPTAGDRYIPYGALATAMDSSTEAKPSAIVLESGVGDQTSIFVHDVALSVSGMTNTEGNGAYTVDYSVYSEGMTIILLQETDTVSEESSPGTVTVDTTGYAMSAMTIPELATIRLSSSKGDQSVWFSAGTLFTVTKATTPSVNKTYTVESATYTGGQTVITVTDGVAAWESSGSSGSVVIGLSDWNAHNNAIAEYSAGSVWLFETPTIGTACFVDTKSQLFIFNGTNWVTLATGISAHDTLTGLGDDDHTQYLNNSRHASVDHTGLTGVPSISGLATEGYVGTAVSTGIENIMGSLYQKPMNGAQTVPPSPPGTGNRYVYTPVSDTCTNFRMAGGHPGMIILDSANGDRTSSFTNGVKITIEGMTHTAGNGVYTVSSSNFAAGYTSINLVEDTSVDESNSPGLILTGDAGVWAGHLYSIAEYNGASWDFTAPVPGMIAYVPGMGYGIYQNGSWGPFTLSESDVLIIGDERYLQNSVIGSDGTLMKYGAASFSTEATKAVVFTTAFADTNYRITFAPYLNTTCWISDKAASGFTLNAGSSITGNVDYSAIHD